MKRLLIAIAAAATTMFASAEVLESEDFESSSWTGVTAAEYGEEETPAALQYPFTGENGMYGVLDDDASSPEAEGATCFDMYVQFTAMTEEPTVDSNAKIAVYADGDGFVHVICDGTDYKTSGTADPGYWARLTIVEVATGYQVYVDGTAVEGAVEDSEDSISVFPAAAGAKKVEFTGSGKLDNFVARTTNPFEARGERAVAVGEFATGGEYFTEVSDDAIAAAAAAGLPLTLYGNAALTATLNAGDSFTLIKGGYELTGLGDKYTVNGNTYTRVSAWSDYLGDAVAGAYTIDDSNDLDKLREGVAAGLSTAGVTFKQTADIDMSEAGAFAGIGEYNATPTAGKPFSGTYDGGNFKICNVDFTQRNYGGVFNQVNGGTIKNLTVSNITCSAFSSSVNDGEWGGAIVGNVGNGATLQNLVAEGTFAADHPATHNVAGIVIRACGGGENGTLIKDCTNNATLYGAYTKIGGICAITQYKIAGGAVTFDGCVNNGDIISSRTTTGVTGYAGILGYNDDNSVLVNCSNTGSIVNNSGANTDKDGAIVGWAYTKDANGVRSLTDQGGNSAAKTDKMLAFVSNLADVTGFKYATVANDVATTVTSLSAGNTYLLEGSVAASETPVFTFAEAGTIAFDAALGYTFEGTVAADTSKIVSLTDATEGSVTTYTAVAGVASVGGQMYATMQDAFDAVTAQNNTVTLLSDLTETVTLNPNETVTITLVANNHSIMTATPFAAANGIVLGVMSDNGDGTLSMNVINNKASTWTGTADDELWATASNWSTGVVPGEYTTVTFNDDGRVRIASNNDVVSVAGMVVNAAVTFSETNIDYSKYPEVKVCGGNVTGTGKLTLERCGLNGNGGAVTVDCDLAFANDTVAGGSIKDSFIKNGASFTINGDVTGTGYLKVMTGTTFNGDVTLGGNAYAMLSVQAAGTVFNGAVTLGDNGYIEMQTSTHAFGEEATLSGTGRIVCYTVAPSATLRPKLTDANGNWEGTLELKGRNANQLQKYSGDALKPDNFGNANSTVCYNGVTGYFAYGTYGNAYTVSTVKCVEIGELGLSIKYDADTDLYSDRQYVFASALKGSGTMSFATKTGDKYTKYVFTGDADEFTGSINFGALETSQPGVIFKTPTETLPVQTAYGQVIVAAGRVGENVVAAGGTWNAPGGIVVHGDVNVGATATLSMVYGDGKLVYAAKPTTPPTFDSTWAGTCVIGWTHGSNALNLNDYGNANSTVKIAADVTGGYIGNGGSTEADKTYTIAPAIELAANVTLTSGWGTGTKNGYLTTFPLLKGGNDKTLTLWGTGYTNYKTYYKFTALDGFGGTIAINTRAYATIETIKVAQTPAVGAKVANITIAEGGTLEDPSSITVKVGDEVQDVTLEFKADGAEGSGLYVAQPPAPKVAEVVNGEQYETLAEALAAATDGATVKLLANIAVTEMQLVTKAVTLDLAGFAITAGERSAEAATAGDDSILCVLHGGSLTINDSSAGGTGAITGNSVFTTGVKMTKKGDTDDTNKATLVVNGGTITGYYYGIAGNGSAGRGNTEVTINGGSVYGTCVNDSVAIFQPQLGTLTINGGYLEGAMGVYVKSGTATVAINGGTIKGNGTYAAYVHSTNGFNNTGDAFVVDNAGYPGGAPAPSILGGTFVSVNASAIASYAKTGLERIVHFADKDAVTITEAKASSEDVFLEKGFPGGEDGKTFTIDTAVQAALAEKIPAGKALTDAVAGTTSGVTYAQAYALGLLDEETGDVEKDVTPTIEIVDGKVVVSLDATAKAGYKVMLNVYEKASLTAEWPVEPTTSYELGSETEAAGFTPSAAGAGFYKVGVTIEDAE